VQNTVFEGAAAASCAIQLDERPGAALLERIRSRRDEIILVESFDL
jgi:D-3-phosphoglycerate dehydrogenase